MYRFGFRDNGLGFHQIRGTISGSPEEGLHHFRVYIAFPLLMETILNLKCGIRMVSSPQAALRSMYQNKA